MNLNDAIEYIKITLEWLKNKPSPVGCILLSPKKEYFFFHNDDRKHCEQIICEKFFCLKEYTIFLTLEPCFSCAFLLYRKRIACIFFGAYNMEHGALGGRINISHFSVNLKYWGGVLKKECECFIKNFFKEKRKKYCN